MTYKCDTCGSIHDTEGGLVSHLQNKEDEAHSQFDSRKKCWKHVMEQNGELEISDPEPEQPEQQTSDHDPEPDEHECPDCGSRKWYDASEVLQAGDYGPEQTRTLANNERVCAACNEVF